MLGERVGDSIAREAESEAKSFIDDLIENISDGEISGRESIQTPGSASETKRAQPRRESSDGEYVVTFEKNGTSVSHRSGSQSDVVADAVEWLVSEQTLVGSLPSFPYVPGKKSAILNDEPVHRNGEKMRQYREINNGYYVFTSLNQGSKKRHISKFADMCGVDVEFGGAW